MINKEQKIMIPISLSDIAEAIKSLVNAEEDYIKPLDKKEASKILGVSVSTVNRLITRTEVPFRKVGGKVVFLKGELVTWLKNQNNVA